MKIGVQDISVKIFKDKKCVPRIQKNLVLLFVQQQFILESNRDFRPPGFTFTAALKCFDLHDDAKLKKLDRRTHLKVMLFSSASIACTHYLFVFCFIVSQNHWHSSILSSIIRSKPTSHPIRNSWRKIRIIISVWIYSLSQNIFVNYKKTEEYKC